MKKLSSHAGAFTVFIASFFISIASASPITGTLQIGNGVVAVNGSPLTGCVDFYNMNPDCGTPGTFTVDAPPSGIFAGALGTSNNVIMDMQQTYPIVKFISLPSINVFFDLPSLTVNPGIVGDCSSTATAVNESCSPAGSPFTIINSSTVNPSTGLADSVTVKLDVNLFGYLNDSLSGETAYHGTFSTQITQLADGTDANIGDILAELNAGRTLSGNSYSATISPVTGTPEPGTSTMLLTGAGMLALGFLARRRSSRI